MVSMAPLLVLNQDELAFVKGIKIRPKSQPVPGQFSGLPTDGNVTLENSGSLLKKTKHTQHCDLSKPFYTCNESF